MDLGSQVGFTISHQRGYLAQEAPRWAQEAPTGIQEAPRGLQQRILKDFGLHFESFGASFVGFRSCILPGSCKRLPGAAGWCVGDFHAQNLANTAWAFATLGQSDVKLFAVLGRAATWCVGDFNVQGLAHTA